MNAQKKTSNPAPLAHRIPAEVSPVIATYAAWLTEQTGYKVDPMSVYIGSQLRSTFQKSDDNQKRIATAAKERAARDAAKAERDAAVKAEPKPTKKAPAKTTPVRQRAAKPATKSSTVATKAGVVIAQQRHIDITTATTKEA